MKLWGPSTFSCKVKLLEKASPRFFGLGESFWGLEVQAEILGSSSSESRSSRLPTTVWASVLYTMPFTFGVYDYTNLCILIWINNYVLLHKLISIHISNCLPNDTIFPTVRVNIYLFIHPSLNKYLYNIWYNKYVNLARRHMLYVIRKRDGIKASLIIFIPERIVKYFYWNRKDILPTKLRTPERQAVRKLLNSLWEN